ncbi:MAG TPA: hypothetical protein VD846_07265 [Allosphingosinicella sp.]|nr:hypothetical protein [Allosphingosinicella sp.]
MSRAGTGGLPFQVAAVCWIDLLGYGSMIAEAEFNPVHPGARASITRLRAFHRIVAEHSDRQYRTLVLNDGAVAYRDLSLRSSRVTYDFLARSAALSEALRASERRNGWPGARMVLAVGFRAKGSRRAMDAASGQLDSILARLDAGQIGAEEAVREAASIDRYFDVLPQLQANFAFTKAYVADAGGSSAGLAGPRLFVDEAIFDGGVPRWVSSEPAIPFQDERLGIKARFVPVDRLVSPRRSGEEIPGMRNALQIAEAIAPSALVWDAIRAAQERASGSAGSKSRRSETAR